MEDFAPANNGNTTGPQVSTSDFGSGAPASPVDTLAEALARLSLKDFDAVTTRIEALREAAIKAESERKERELQENKNRLFDFVTNELGTTLEVLGFMPIPDKPKRARRSSAADASEQPKKPKRAAKDSGTFRPLLLVLKSDPTVGYAYGRAYKGIHSDGTRDDSKWRKPTAAESARWAKYGTLK